MSKPDLKSLINLDECVINALELFASRRGKLPRLDLGNFKRPLVVGSGNAAATGKIVFKDQDAVFADESTYKRALQTVKSIDGVVLISASGGKHAPEIARFLGARKNKPRLVLLTCNKDADAKKDVDEMIVFPHNPEPYTYNTSTYMGMILAGTEESPRQIISHIKRTVEPVLNKYSESFANFGAFFVLVPEEFDLIRDMLRTKFVELFGRKIARDIFTWEQAKHATTVVESDAELFISFGRENKFWGKHRLYIPLPKNADYAAMMAAGYYVIGRIQAQKLPWFKESIPAYCQAAPKHFGKKKPLPLIVKYLKLTDS